MLGRQIAARQPPPTCLSELRRALLDEWCHIPQDQIDNLKLSRPRRLNFNVYPLVAWGISVGSPGLSFRQEFFNMSCPLELQKHAT
ncbi:hypothetical protein TNCV_4136971 [Trichonephila clavipes]|nr:hypothetical protein TNCV_4136971 [Trichonephila clavipes]